MEVKLVFINEDRTLQSFPLPSAVTFIGRRQDCDLCIRLSVVSRRHCEIYSEFGRVMIRDLKSHNGTYVNGESIDEVQLNAGDTVRIGPVHFVVQIDGVPDNFDKYTANKTGHPATPPAKTVEPATDETQDASDFDHLIEGLGGGSAGQQGQTMSLDEVFTSDLLGDDVLDLDSDLDSELDSELD